MYEKYDLKNISALSLDLVVKNMNLYKNIFCQILDFEIIYENSYNIVFHNSELSKDLFITIVENSDMKNDVVKLDDDNVLVFYLENEMIYSNICSVLIKNGVPTVKSFNPYWDENGKTFLISDDENFRIVFCRKKFKSLAYGLVYNARIAMPTHSLDHVKEMFINRYGMNKISFFSNHDNFDGIMLSPNELLDCHIEFTQYFGNDHKLSDSLNYNLSFINESSYKSYFSYNILTSIDFIMSENKSSEAYCCILDYMRVKF
ncbi:hypothetical protein [Fluviispira sanaruensis]|uniref:VOC domain-containing protein n=1 Tax=Fluviispira sanaruensis TaxID=2493639 RepID=A0A4P2VN09_FLUSA|nr:hypothetical protein [Fluviispira sanaruensis]BBH54401.1 hypothetical protein JCM31447_28660 [Fluviispira sanaruensis]